MIFLFLNPLIFMMVADVAKTDVAADSSAECVAKVVADSSAEYVINTFGG
jgi:hypothetical protein